MTTAPSPADEGVLDPWVAEWLKTNDLRAQPLEVLDPEILELARGPMGFPVTRQVAHVTDESVEGIPVRIYQGDAAPTGVIVYFHGGGFVIGSIGIMDNVARELAHCSGAAVISVGYRLAPEHPYPAGLDDCVAVTKWAMAHADRFGLTASSVVVAGESAGGNLSAAVSLRLRDEGGPNPAAQVLIYPATASDSHHPSRHEFSGLIISLAGADMYWTAYSCGRDLSADPYAAPLNAPSLAGLPPALVILGGCDMLRDEGREYAGRMSQAGVEVEEVCYAGQPHGFINFEFPAAATAFERIGTWLRPILDRSPAG